MDSDLLSVLSLLKPVRSSRHEIRFYLFEYKSSIISTL